MNFDLKKLIRNNIKSLKPYSAARHEFNGKASVFLDANENPYGSPLDEAYNRYPDPLQWQLKFQLARIKGVPAENIFVGNGSDEVIDLAFRIFCDPQKDNVIVCPPTYGMYEVSAGINDISVKKVPLTADYQLDVSAVLNAVDECTKLLFICSPNNPTGNSLRKDDIELLLLEFKGLVIIDEAYINYSRQQTFISQLTKYPNLVVMQTLSKAWGMAALRVGLCYASMDIIDVLNKIKPPYNINEASQHIATEALQRTTLVNGWIRETVEQRQWVSEELSKCKCVQKVFPSDANFLLVRVGDADALYKFLTEHEIVARNRTHEPGCENCLRITIGTPVENKKLIQVINKFTA